MLKFGQGAPPTGSARVGTIPLSSELLSAHVEPLKAIPAQPVRQRSKVGEFGVLSTMPGSSAPPTLVPALKVGIPDGLVIVAPENQPPVRLAALNKSGEPTSTWLQNFDAEHQVKGDPSPAPTVCVCTALRSV